MENNRIYNPKLKPNAQFLRKNMTKEERILWHQFLKKLSVPFYRQKAIGRYIVDFYCPRRKLVIELDGSQHFDREGLDHDAERDAFLKGLGLTVLRIPNNAVTQNLRGVADEILRLVPGAEVVRD